jgi:hypothetical protein
LTLTGDETTTPGTHVAYFVGDHPCNQDGSEIAQIRHSSGPFQLTQDLTANFSFSNKPTGGYLNYFDKMTRYIEMISAPARSLDHTVTAFTYIPVEGGPEESVFNYLDTASSRAGIAVISGRLKNDKVAIIGLGGTGSYVLDFVSKTSVAEIHLFDGDDFLQHNAFRTPGAASLDELKAKSKKVEYLHSIYSKLRHGIILHDHFVTELNVHELKGFDFVFICIDSGNSRKLIAEALIASSTPFIDVGMGVEVTDDPKMLWGICRTSLVTQAKSGHIHTRLPLIDNERDDLYGKNIQVAELNSLNAALAVIRWKKFRGLYHDDENEHHLTYTTSTNLLTSEERMP